MAKIAHSRDYKAFSVFLKETRHKAGMTQKDVAAVLSIHQSYVSKYETCEHRFNVIELRLICRA